MAADIPSSLTYRPEVDGLRALAVLPVMLFHAQVGWPAGGFIGVDVFFVISGFLITSILLHEQRAGQFSLVRFYARRARRILPALVLVMACCAPMALWLAREEELKSFASLFMAAAVAGSNFVLASGTGYFDTPADYQPLLHTWSLAVEEQFYLIFPMLLAGLWRLGTRTAGGLLVLAGVVSLLVAQWGQHHFQGANFYLATGRAWELIVGCACAWAATRPGGAPALRSRWAREALPAAGLLAILASYVVLSPRTPTPGVALLPAVAGAAVVLLFATPSTWTGRALAAPPLVAIGLVSYSAYLWHQPVLVFARMHLGGPLPPMWQAAALALTLLLAWLTWHLIEQPFRRRLRVGDGVTLTVSVVAMLALVAAGAVMHAKAHELQRPLPDALKVAFQPPQRSAACFDVKQAHVKPEAWCAIHPGAETSPSFALYGDSHALHLLDAFDAAARQAGRRGVFVGYGGCPPLLGVVALTRNEDPDHDCQALARQMLAHARAAGVRDVFLVAKWSYFTHFWLGGAYLNALGERPDDPVSLERSRAALRSGIARTTRAYADAGIRVHIVEQVPQQAQDPRWLYPRVLRDRGTASRALAEAAVTFDAHRRLQADAADAMRQPGLPPLQRLNFDDLLCHDGRCPVGTVQLSWYMDRSHLSSEGAARLVPRLAAALTPPAR